MELLLYIGISSTLLVSLVLFLGTLTQAQVKNQATLEVEYQGGHIIALIKQLATNAESVNSPAPGASGSTLTLNMTATEDDPTIFSINSGSLEISRGANAPLGINNSRVNISNLLFENLGRPGTADIVRITFTLSHFNPEGRNEYEYSKTFYGSINVQ